MLWQIVQSVIRHGLTSIGSVIVAKGLSSQSDEVTAIGAIMTLIGFGHSLYAKWKASKPKPTPPAGSPKGVILLFAFICAAGFALVGCSTTPQQATYQAAGSAIVSVDTAMNLWGAYVAAAHPGTNAELAVENAFDKYQTAAVVVCDAGAAYAASGGTNGTAAAALNQAIANSGQDLSDLETLITSFGVKLQ